MPTTRDEVQTITARLYALRAAVLAKTGKSPWYGPQLHIEDSQCRITLYPGDSVPPPLGVFKGDTPNEALDAAESFVAAMPDLATAQLHAHLKSLAACIDKGRANGIPEAYLAPLAATVAAISKNLLPPPDANAQP